MALTTTGASQGGTDEDERPPQLLGNEVEARAPHGPTHVLPLGGDPKRVLHSIAELGAQSASFLVPSSRGPEAAEVADMLDAIGVDVDIQVLDGPVPLSSLLGAIDDAIEAYEASRDQILVNLAGASKHTACAAMLAGYMRGLKIVEQVDGRVLLLPALELRYEEQISEAKVSILQALDALGGETTDLHTLANEAGVNSSLASHHIRGGKEGPGLEDLGLVFVERGKQGRLAIRLTPMGDLVGRRLIALPEDPAPITGLEK